MILSRESAAFDIETHTKNFSFGIIHAVKYVSVQYYMYFETNSEIIYNFEVF